MPLVAKCYALKSLFLKSAGMPYRKYRIKLLFHTHRRKLSLNNAGLFGGKDG